MLFTIWIANYSFQSTSERSIQTKAVQIKAKLAQNLVTESLQNCVMVKSTNLYLKMSNWFCKGPDFGKAIPLVIAEGATLKLLASLLWRGGVGEEEFEGVEPARLWSFFSASWSEVSSGWAMPATFNISRERSNQPPPKLRPQINPTSGKTAKEIFGELKIKIKYLFPY